MNLTICIPTWNRSLFLNRTLKYYSNMNFDGVILIADSSNKTEKEWNKKFIKNYPNLNIDYHWFKPETIYHDAMKTYLCLNHIKTDFITFSGDDDFQIPSGLEKCIEFLNKNADYIAAHGHRLNFTLNDAVYGNVVSLDIHDGYDWQTGNIIEQWREYLRCGIATTYYVHRTDMWKKYYNFSFDAKSNYLGNELLPCSMCSLLGKVKRLDCISTAFQRDNPIRKFSFKKTTLWDLIHTNEWMKSAKIFEEAVVFELNKIMSKEDAKDLFYKEFWYHCLLIMNSQFNNKYSEQKQEDRKPMDLSSMTERDVFYPIYKILNYENDIK